MSGNRSDWSYDRPQPGRQYNAYLYVPLLAFSVAVAGLAQWRPWRALLFLAFWIPASYDQYRALQELVVQL